MNETNTPKPVGLNSFNVNSILSAILLAAMLWVGTTTAGNNKSLTEIKTQLPYVADSIRKLEERTGALVTRAELDGRFSETSAKLSVLENRLMRIEFEKKKTTTEP